MKKSIILSRLSYKQFGCAFHEISAWFVCEKNFREPLVAIFACTHKIFPSTAKENKKDLLVTDSFHRDSRKARMCVWSASHIFWCRPPASVWRKHLVQLVVAGSRVIIYFYIFYILLYILSTQHPLSSWAMALFCWCCLIARWMFHLWLQNEEMHKQMNSLTSSHPVGFQYLCNLQEGK